MLPIVGVRFLLTLCVCMFACVLASKTRPTYFCGTKLRNLTILSKKYGLRNEKSVLIVRYIYWERVIVGVNNKLDNGDFKSLAAPSNCKWKILIIKIYSVTLRCSSPPSPLSPPPPQALLFTLYFAFILIVDSCSVTSTHEQARVRLAHIYWHFALDRKGGNATFHAPWNICARGDRNYPMKIDPFCLTWSRYDFYC